MKKVRIFSKKLIPILIFFLTFLPFILEDVITPKRAYAINWKKYKIVQERGLFHAEKGNYEKAIYFLDQAIEIYKGDSGVFYDRGTVHMELGNYKNALKDLKKALKLDSKMSNQYTFNNLGVVYQELGDYENALDSYSKAIEIDSKDGLYFHNRGYINMQLERWDDALKDYQTALIKYPQNKKGRGYLNCPENKDLIHCHMNEYFYNDLGWINANLKNYNAAINYYDKSIEINPTEGLFYTNKGSTFYEMGKMKNACINYRKSSSLGFKEIDNYLSSPDGKWCKKIKL